jgi:hypothetical protein
VRVEGQQLGASVRVRVGVRVRVRVRVRARVRVTVRARVSSSSAPAVSQKARTRAASLGVESSRASRSSDASLPRSSASIARLGSVE